VTVKNSSAPRCREAILLCIASLQCVLAAALLAWARAFRPDRETQARLRLAAPLGKLRWRALAGLYAMERRGQTGHSLRVLMMA
jgi:hypothetical protein